jgi:hypothetical protein
MHTSGKVLAFLVVLLAITASILTAKLVQVRNSWTAKSVASKNKFNDISPKVVALQAQIDSLNNELFRSRELWGTLPLPAQTEVVNQNDGTVRVGFGSDAGLRDKLLMHGFEITADGTSVYRGSFLPVEIQNVGATLKPNWRATPEDVRTWQSGNWRWRNLVPPGYVENFDKQLTTILKYEETLNDRVRTLNGQKKLLAEAKSKLKLREAELVGGEELPKINSVDPEFREGLVAAMAVAEEDRNQTLLTIDKLRREVRSIQADIEQMLNENNELTARLPQPGPTSPLSVKKNDSSVNQ